MKNKMYDNSIILTHNGQSNKTEIAPSYDTLSVTYGVVDNVQRQIDYLKTELEQIKAEKKHCRIYIKSVEW